MENLVANLNWRYATKKMNGGRIPDEKLHNIMDVIGLSPSSFGLQPYKIFIVEEQAVRERIFTESCHQMQVKDASAVLVFAAYNKITREYIDRHLANMEAIRGPLSPEVKQFLLQSYEHYLNLTVKETFDWAVRQVYIALGYATIAAATLQVDASPMEGFDPAAMDAILQLGKQHLTSAVVLAVGYRDEVNDWLVKLPKVRKSQADLFIAVRENAGSSR